MTLLEKADQEVTARMATIFHDAPQGLQAEAFFNRLGHALGMPQEAIDLLIEEHYAQHPGCVWVGPPGEAPDASVEVIHWPIDARNLH